MVNRKNVNNVLIKTAQYAQEKLLKYKGNNNNINNNNIIGSNNVQPNNDLSNFILSNPTLSLLINNIPLLNWVIENAKLMKPNSIRIINGSDEENKELTDLLVDQGSLIPLNEQYPNSYAAFSDPSDVARVEKQTFICSEKEEDAGPTNNWKDPIEMMNLLNDLFNGCMKGRVMYVIPFSMGPLNSSFSKYGVQITDSPYVVLNMRIMTRIGSPVLEIITNEENKKEYIECVHSVGSPLNPGQKDVTWPCNSTKYIVHFPHTKRIFSFGSGYGGNALLGKKCFALRIASDMGRKEGWLAEHMLILSLTNPLGEKKYFAAAFPSACGKTNLAMLNPTIPGWKVETLGDDIAWIRKGEDGRLYACNPENGFFGVAPGTSPQNNPNALKTLQSNSLFTNVAITEDKSIWWEGLTEKIPSNLISWRGKKNLLVSDAPFAHPNSRFTAPISQCPIIDKDWDSPLGVPLSGILFGGRRKTTIPLVRESLDWNNGVFFGASISSEQTAAAEGSIGDLRHDPFAMLPFCGYNMADYFLHWFLMADNNTNNNDNNQNNNNNNNDNDHQDLHLNNNNNNGDNIIIDKEDNNNDNNDNGDNKNNLMPKIFYVNWFRCDENGKFLWPGFGENGRVLKWIFERTSGTKGAIETPIGLIPKPGDLDLPISVTDQALKDLFKIDLVEWANEIQSIERFMSRFGDRLPVQMKSQIDNLKERLNNYSK